MANDAALIFEWDGEKAQANLRKHGVTFQEAATVFGDLLSLSIPDPLHSMAEERFILMGESIRGRILVVVHAERESTIRIISAREATPREKRSYGQDDGGSTT